MKFTKGPPETTNRNAPEPEASRGWYSRGYLPHFDVSGLYQAITYRLGDSLPGSAGVPPASSTLTDDEKKARRILIEGTLDKGYGSCILREAEFAKIVVDGWKYFDGERYDLVAYVVMPNHVHVLIKTYVGFALSKVVHSWKSYSGHEINRRLIERKEGGRDARAPGDRRFVEREISGRDDCAPGDRRLDVCAPGKVWQNEYFDRFIRDERHFAQAIAYIHENPVKAGLCRHASEWPWSSGSANA